MNFGWLLARHLDLERNEQRVEAQEQVGHAGRLERSCVDLSQVAQSAVLVGDGFLDALLQPRLRLLGHTVSNEKRASHE